MPVDMKRMIADTFASMAKQTSVDKITVKALISACNISRQTFYYHFQDIMEVIEWSVKHATQNVLSSSMEAKTLEEALSAFITSIMEKYALIRKLMDSQKRAQIEKLFVQATRTYLQELVRNRTSGLSVNYSEMEFILDFWAFGVSGLLLKYCSQDQTDAKKLANQICRLLSGKKEQEKK